MRLVSIVAGLILITANAAADDPELEVTEDGLVRAPSSRKVGVYRAPGVAFTQYRRISLGPIPVTFKRTWLRANSHIRESERTRMQNDLAELFRQELISELAERGGYSLAETTELDVLRVDAAISDLDITAPDAGMQPGQSTLVRNTGTMTLVIELRDAASGVIIGRVIDYEQGREFREPQVANQVTNNHEARMAFGNAARYTREALNVAKTTRGE